MVKWMRNFINIELETRRLYNRRIVVIDCEETKISISKIKLDNVPPLNDIKVTPSVLYHKT